MPSANSSKSYFGPYSRYKSTGRFIYNGTVTLGLWQPPAYITTRPPESQINVMVVPHGMAGRPDLISQQVYHTPELDWVLIAFNKISDVFGWPRVGELIEYPDESLVMLGQ